MMNGFADILPLVGRYFPLLLTYAVPREMADRLQIGSLVLVPLGERIVGGYVVSVHSQPPRLKSLRPIHSLADAPPAFTEREVALARWIAEYYCCSLAEALRPFLSEAGGMRARRRMRLTPAGEEQLRQACGDRKEESLIALRVIRERGGKISRRTLAALLGERRIGAILHHLKEQGLVEEIASAVSSIRQKYAEFVSLAVSKKAARRRAKKLTYRAPRQAAVLDFLSRRGVGKGLASEAKCGERRVPEEVPVLEVVRATGSRNAFRALHRQGLVRISQQARWRIPWPDAPTDYHPTPRLNPQQRAVAKEILQAVREGRPETFLLFGVTASGKTEIFLRATAQALEKGKQALLLVPEISLTAQVVGLLRSRFGGTVAVLHSALSRGERRDEKERIRLGEARVVVGPRSALFAPFRHLGIIVVDEEHDTSYKQEQEPRYHAREVSLKLAEQFACPCLLASATPAMESFHLAQRGIYRLLRLEERAEGRPLPRVHLLDQRGKSRRPEILLPSLRQALADCLEADGQAILFLNRRGHSTFLFCPSCGHAFRCPHCQVALVYHSQQRLLRCHHCDYSLPAPTLCPNCQGSTLRFAGFGTQRVAEELQRLFPSARVARMDRDTTSTKGAHLRLVTDFRAAATDLLVGTQMVSKGLHFPGVTVVGVVAADISLNKPDFRAAERTFQLLTQVAGRAGRGAERGEVYIQTYHPEHYAIQAASAHDYEAFYAEEIKLREEAGYPPFRHLANIVVSGPEPEKTRELCQRLAGVIREESQGQALEVLGPAPAPLAKLRDHYRYHFLLRAEEAGILQKVLRARQEDLASRGKIRVSVDVDPLSLM